MSKLCRKPKNGQFASEVFHFLLSDDVQMSESKHFLKNHSGGGQGNAGVEVIKRALFIKRALSQSEHFCSVRVWGLAAAVGAAGHRRRRLGVRGPQHRAKPGMRRAYVSKLCRKPKNGQFASEVFHFILSDDVQMSESKHFSLNFPRSPPFHQNLVIL